MGPLPKLERLHSLYDMEEAALLVPGYINSCADCEVEVRLLDKRTTVTNLCREVEGVEWLVELHMLGLQLNDTYQDLWCR